MIEGLKTGGSEVAPFVADILVQKGREVVPALMDLWADDKHSNIRPYLIGILGEIGDPQALPLILLAMDDKNEQVQRAASEAVIKFVPYIKSDLGHFLNNPDWQIRKQTANFLRTIAWQPTNQQEEIQLRFALQDWDGIVAMGQAGISRLIEGLKDQDEDIRRSIVGSLGRVGGEQAATALLGAFDDPRKIVRESAKSVFIDIFVASFEPWKDRYKSFLNRHALVSQTAPTKSYFRRDKDGWRLYLNGNKSYPVLGAAYQPVPAGKHINDYRENLSEIYRSLLDEKDGGQGHARRLYEMGVTSIRIYEITTTNGEDMRTLKAVFNLDFRHF